MQEGTHPGGVLGAHPVEELLQDRADLLLVLRLRQEGSGRGQQQGREKKPSHGNSESER
jgi:hypothetical protein